MEFLQIGLQFFVSGLSVTGPKVFDDGPPGPDHPVAAQRAQPDDPLLQEIDEGIGDRNKDLVLARFRKLAIELNKDGRAFLGVVDDRFG